MDKRPAKPSSGDSPESLRNRRRSRRVRTLTDDDESIPSKDISPDRQAESHEHIGLLRDGLARLSEQDREVLRLRYFESWTLSAIGRHLGMTVPEVRNRLTAATADLLAKFGPNMSDYDNLFGSPPPLLAPHLETGGLSAAPPLVTCSAFLRRYALRGMTPDAELPLSFVGMAERNPDCPLIGVLVLWLNHVKNLKAIYEYSDLYQLRSFTFDDQVRATHFLAQRVEAVLVHEGWSEQAQYLVRLLVDMLAFYNFKFDYLDNLDKSELKYFFLKSDGDSATLADLDSILPPPPPAEPVSRLYDWSPHLDAAIAAVPTSGSYQEIAALCAELHHDVKQRIAEQIAPALNARIQEMPYETLDQKKELARWVIEQLEPLGLAVKCPNTGLPAKLRGVAGNYRPDVPGGTFCFEIYQDGKQRKTAYSDVPPELTLMDATPPPEPGMAWQQAVGTKASRASRRR